MATPRTGRPVGRPPGTAKGLLSSPERHAYMTALWHEGLSDERIARALSDVYKVFISKNVVVGRRYLAGLRR